MFLKFRCAHIMQPRSFLLNNSFCVIKECNQETNHDTSFSLKKQSFRTEQLKICFFKHFRTNVVLNLMNEFKGEGSYRSPKCSSISSSMKIQGQLKEFIN